MIDINERLSDVELYTPFVFPLAVWIGAMIYVIYQWLERGE